MDPGGRVLPCFVPTRNSKSLAADGMDPAWTLGGRDR